MKAFLAILLVFTVTGCQRTTRVDMGNEQVELSPETMEAIEEIVRDVVREELATPSDPGAVNSAIQEVKRVDEERRLEEKKKNADQLVLTSMRIASDVQAWERKPVAFGGGGRSGSYDGVALEKIGYPIDEAGVYSTVQGKFNLEVIENGAKILITATNETYGTEVLVTVSGPLVSDIQTEIRNTPTDR